MSIVKSLSVGLGDMYYIRHSTDNFTMIDCSLSDENKKRIVEELKNQSIDKRVKRFISTHPDDSLRSGSPFCGYRHLPNT
jgi:hypothetical protein